jgi:hypothetical protein
MFLTFLGNSWFVCFVFTSNSAYAVPLFDGFKKEWS